MLCGLFEIDKLCLYLENEGWTGLSKHLHIYSNVLYVDWQIDNLAFLQWSKSMRARARWRVRPNLTTS